MQDDEKTAPDAPETKNLTDFAGLEALAKEKQPPAPPKAVPSGWASDPLATLAAQQAFEAGASEEECFEAALAAVQTAEDAEIEEVEQNEAELNSRLEHDYYISVCNLARGTADLTKAEAKKSAAAVGALTVSFEIWKRRLGY